MSLNPLRALGSASCHRIFKDFDEMEHHQSHEMRVVAWLCEITLTPAWPQYAGIPHPASGREIPEENRIRERKPTRWLFLQVLPIPWTVGGIASGEGQTGRGQKPPPLSTFSMTVKGAKRGKNTPEDLRILGDNEH